MRSILFIICMAFALSGQAAIYKWVDSSGAVHYSDTPTRDAKEIKLSDPTVYTPVSGNSVNGGAPTSTKSTKPVKYSSFVIVAPANNEMVQANGGSVTIRFQTEPALQAGHYIQVVLDGRIQDQHATGPQIQLNNLTRGAHMIHASIHDAAGRLVSRSNIVQFFVRQTSVIEDGKSPEPPDSGSSGSGADAPQYAPGSGSDYSGDGAQPGGADAFNPTSKPISSTPGQTNPAFSPNY